MPPDVVDLIGRDFALPSKTASKHFSDQRAETTTVNGAIKRGLFVLSPCMEIGTLSPYSAHVYSGTLPRPRFFAPMFTPALYPDPVFSDPVFSLEPS
jgi:hypothetical protein